VDEESSLLSQMADGERIAPFPVRLTNLKARALGLCYLKVDRGDNLWVEGDLHLVGADALDVIG
jgi:hypothetical protein